jgi:hypothetical protein
MHTKTATRPVPSYLAPHPAPYSKELMPVLARMLRGHRRIHDPFAGTGRIFDLEAHLPGAVISASELQPRWAAHHPKTEIGDATDLPYPDGAFDAIATSPVYPNRLTDHHNAQDDSHRINYTEYYGEPLQPNNAGAMPWGDKWRNLHTTAFTEFKRLLCPGGAFILNMKDFIKTVPESKAGEPYYERLESQTSKSGVQVRVNVTDWCVDVCRGLGFQVVESEDVDCPGMRKGQNGAARIPYETVIKFQLGTQRQEQHFSMSRNYEWGTPGYIVDMARQVMGGIDLDPASSALWNMATVRATTFWGLFDWGLRRDWFGRVFINPPFGKFRSQSNLKLWTTKLIEEYDAGRVGSAICVTTDAMSDGFMHEIKRRFPICLPDGRISFIGEDGKPIPGNTKGTAIAYLGPDERGFASVFNEIGTVMKAIH